MCVAVLLLVLGMCSSMGERGREGEGREGGRKGGREGGTEREVVEDGEVREGKSMFNITL